MRRPSYLLSLTTVLVLLPHAHAGWKHVHVHHGAAGVYFAPTGVAMVPAGVAMAPASVSYVPAGVMAMPTSSFGVSSTGCMGSSSMLVPTSGVSMVPMGAFGSAAFGSTGFGGGTNTASTSGMTSTQSIVEVIGIAGKVIDILKPLLGNSGNNQGPADGSSLSRIENRLDAIEGKLDRALRLSAQPRTRNKGGSGGTIPDPNTVPRVFSQSTEAGAMSLEEAIQSLAVSNKQISDSLAHQNRILESLSQSRQPQAAEKKKRGSR